MDEKLRDALAKIYELVANGFKDLNAKLDKTSNDKQFINNEFYEINGKNTFVKLKANSFGIGKVLFAFVQFDEATKKLNTSMDVYMDMDDAMLFAQDILSGRIPSLAEQERAKGAQYPAAIWNSPMGGITEEKAKQRGLRQDGKAISRMFNLAPGSRQPFVFTAEQRPGNTDAKGLIVPEKNGKPEVQIRVPSSNEDLKKMALAIQSNINAYRTAQYANGAFNVNPSNK